MFLAGLFAAPVVDLPFESEAQAGPRPWKEAAERRKERREKRRERRKARRTWAKGARKAWRARAHLRRRAARRALVRRWGRIYKHPRVHAELGLHAWREARLERMRYLAEKTGNEEALAKIDELEAKEDARHEARMEALKGDAGAGEASTDETPETATTATAEAQTP